MNIIYSRVFAVLVVLLFVSYPIASAQGTNDYFAVTYVNDERGIFRDLSALENQLSDVHERTGAKFVIETLSLSGLSIFQIENTARQRFSFHGLDYRYDDSNSALNVLILFDPETKVGKIVDSKNCGYDNDEITVATNNRAAFEMIEINDYDSAFSLIAKELSLLVEKRLQEGIYCTPIFEEVNENAKSLVFNSALAQLDPNWEAARDRIKADARRLAVDLEQQGKISDIGHVLDEFDISSRNYFFGRAIEREIKVLEAKIEALENVEYNKLETPILQYLVEDPATKALLREELDGVNFVFVCLKKGKSITEIKSDTRTCLGDNIFDQIVSSLFGDSGYLVGDALKAKIFIDENPTLNMLWWVEQLQHEKPEDRLCAAYANSAAFLEGIDKDAKAIESYRVAQVYCRGVSNIRYKSVPADAEQLIFKLQRGDVGDAAWNVGKGLTSPLNIAVIGGTVVISVVAPPAGAYIAGARGAAIAQQCVAGAKLVTGAYFAGHLAYGLSEHAGMCLGLGFEPESADCASVIIEAGMIALIVSSGPKHAREFKAADSLRIQAETLEVNIKKLQDIVLYSPKESALIAAGEITHLKAQLAQMNQFLSKPNANAILIADEILKDAKDTTNIPDQVLDIVVDMQARSASRQAANAITRDYPPDYIKSINPSEAVTADISRAASNILEFVVEVQKAQDGATAGECRVASKLPSKVNVVEGLSDVKIDGLKKLEDRVPLFRRGKRESSAPEGKVLADIVKSVLENEKIMSEVLNELGLEGVPELYNIEFIGEGQLAAAVRVDITISGKPVGKFVVKAGKVDSFEYELTREFGEYDVSQKELTSDFPGIFGKYGVLVEEFIEGQTIKEIFAKDVFSESSVAEAIGDLQGRLWSSTQVSDGSTFTAFTIFDANYANIVISKKTSGLEAKYVDVDPRLSSKANFPQAILPTASLYADSPALIKPYFNGMLKHLGSIENALKLLREAEDYYSNVEVGTLKSYGVAKVPKGGLQGFKTKEFNAFAQGDNLVLEIKDVTLMRQWAKEIRDIIATIEEAQTTDFRFVVNE